MIDQVGVYLDACCFIEVVKAEKTNSPGQSASNEVWYLKRLMQAHRDRELTLYTSAITIAEAVHIGKTPVPQDVQNRFEALLTSGQYVHLVQTTPFICEDARNLRWIDQVALRGADSLHLASAINRNCSEFVTMDSRFERIQEWNSKLSAKGIVASLPSTTKSLPDKYLQSDIFDDETKL